MAGLISYPPSNDLEYYLNEILSLVETLIKIYKLNSQGPERLEPRSFFQIRGVISSTMLVTLTAREASTRTRGLEWPNAAGTPEEMYDGKRIALAIEAAGMDDRNSENKDIPYGKYKSIPQFRDTMDEVIGSLQRRSFLWVGEVGDFGLGGLATLFGYYEDSAVQLEFIDPEAPPSGPISILPSK
ncbi:hypothetical protein HYALB_00003075 [Hymenoscyphus albidus]|uniref:Uncharacterized protein n=1 Tax=Hymenoscyphus albidus TaxID=595503 RepID=A0A9N9LVB1_9HELO|nr:hypothetical protein HYALB_00003075 [Hymenoscyphus albidus]